MSSNPTSGQVELTPVGQRFTFACHPGVKCFNLCCAKLELPLTPYDVLRLKNRLGLPAGEFLEEYTEPAKANRSRWPLLELKMNRAEGQPCPFVSAEGCTVYKDRPSACRIYPLARATRVGFAEGEVWEQYYRVEESHCQGFAEDRIWSVKEWVSDQGLLPYHKFNDAWMKVVTHPQGPGSGTKGEANKRMFYLASYNLDRFREFVNQPKFLSAFDLGPNSAEKIKDDEWLLTLAVNWLRFSLLGERTMSLKANPPGE